MANNTTVKREYVDNFSVKELMVDTVVPKYFDSEEISQRTIGMIGYTTELVTNSSEDSFNASSVMFRESFANRSQLTESIYSHAALFQIDDVFARAATCRFLLVLDESAIIKNMTQKTQGSSIYNFFIDKDTTIYVEEQPFTLDYDIRLDIVKKVTDKGIDYIFTAEYIMDEYTYGNSISEISDPYVKLRRSVDGYIALEVMTHQCVRDVRYETITSNSSINYPTIDIKDFDGKLCGFDILYKDPSGAYSKDGSAIQMRTQIVYSQALKIPFCYYQVIDEDTLRITFNTKDLFFMPEFNSELTIILYITEGDAGNFDIYEGNNISLIPSTEKYVYASSYLTAAKPIGSSSEGTDSQDVSSVQALAVEGYRTANALTTDHDLQQFFNNYKYRYGDTNMLFIKKRNDIFERVFSAFLVMSNGDFIYKTNTLNLQLNLYDMRNPEKDVFMLDPGVLFIANDTDGYAKFFRDEFKHKIYLRDYNNLVAQGQLNFVPDTIYHGDIPAYLQDRPMSFAQYKSTYKLEDKKYVFDLTEDQIKEYDDPNNEKFLLINPFLIRFTKSPNLVSTYMTYVSNTSILDFTDQNTDSYVQFITYTLNVDRRFSHEKKYEVSMSVAPSIGVNTSQPLVAIDGKDEITGKPIYHFNDIYSLENNDFRAFMLVKDGSRKICFVELYPSEIDADTQSTFTFKCDFLTDDHITSEGYLRILPGTIYRNKETGEYYKVHTNDMTLYDQYDKNDTLVQENISINTVTELRNDGILYEYNKVHNMTMMDDILIPLSDVTCEIYTLYKRHFDESTGTLMENTDDMTNNTLVNYDQSLIKYVWTNVYLTSQEPITFVKPLDSVRTYLTFDDYTKANQNDDGTLTYEHDIFDANMYSLAFLRAGTYYDSDRLTYFMKSFYNNYLYLVDIMKNRLRNATNIDVKFYNTYGRSRNFLIGEDEEVLNTVNLSLDFDMWFVAGTDTTIVIPEVKLFIKKTVESINSNGMNNLFISNLMRKIELNFAYIDHIRFKKINSYDSTYQAVKNYTTDLDSLSVLERRFYVPELLVCDEDDITITEYYAQ